MKRHRRKHTAEFKARVALEALKGIKTASEIAHEYEIHPVMVSKWKKELISRMPVSVSRPENPHQPSQMTYHRY
jgi:transposase